MTNAKAKLPNVKTKDVLIPCMGYRLRLCLLEYHVLPLILHRYTLKSGVVFHRVCPCAHPR